MLQARTPEESRAQNAALRATFATLSVPEQVALTVLFTRIERTTDGSDERYALMDCFRWYSCYGEPPL